MSDDKQQQQDKPKRGGSKPGRRIGPLDNPNKVQKEKAPESRPKKRGPYKDDQYR